ncbi:unnamed protein product [Meganyctiphanes norvegica]|uniref:ShKT domain-containing protein n=1 Tax=Meganyctiphanes norvegica TaxID=48144 RepID=A0AAV2PST1_MEGNR
MTGLLYQNAMLATLFSAAILVLDCQALIETETNLFGHNDLEIEAWSEASDMERLTYHRTEGSDSVLNTEARYRLQQAHQNQKLNNLEKSALFRNTEDDALAASNFMVCQNVMEYCDLYSHSGICQFQKWMDICTKTCDPFSCNEGEVESCGVVEAITEDFRKAFLDQVSINADHFSNTHGELVQAFEDIDMVSSNPPSHGNSTDDN